MSGASFFNPQIDNYTSLGFPNASYPNSLYLTRWYSLGIGSGGILQWNTNAPSSLYPTYFPKYTNAFGFWLNTTNGALYSTRNVNGVVYDTLLSTTNGTVDPAFAQLYRAGTNNTAYTSGADITNFTTLTTSGGYTGSIATGTVTNTIAGYHQVTFGASLNTSAESLLTLYTNGVSTGYSWPQFTATNTIGRGITGGPFMIYLPANTAVSVRGNAGTAVGYGFLQIYFPQ